MFIIEYFFLDKWMVLEYAEGDMRDVLAYVNTRSDSQNIRIRRIHEFPPSAQWQLIGKSRKTFESGS